jgi:hypothetical protein
VDVYLLQRHLSPLFFWSWLLQINFLSLIVFFIILILFIVAGVLDSDAIKPIDRLWENLIADGNTQLEIVVVNAERVVFHCGEIRLTSA